MRYALAFVLLLPAAAQAQQDPLRHAEQLRATFPDSVEVQAVGPWPGGGDTAVLLSFREGPGLRLLRLTPHADGAEILADISLAVGGSVEAGFVEPTEGGAVLAAVVGEDQDRLWLASLGPDGRPSETTLALGQPTRVHGIVPLSGGGVFVAGSVLDPAKSGRPTEAFVGVARDGAWESSERYPADEATWFKARLAPALDGGALVLWSRFVAEPRRTALSLFRYAPDGSRVANSPVGAYTNTAVDVLDDPRGLALVFATGLDAERANAATYVPDVPFVHAVAAADGRAALYPHPAVAQGLEEGSPSLAAGGGVLGGATVWLVSQGSSKSFYTCPMDLVNRRGTLFGDSHPSEERPPDPSVPGPRLVAGARYAATLSPPPDYMGTNACSTASATGLGEQTRSRLALLLLDPDGSVRQQLVLDDLVPTRNERLRPIPDGLRIEAVSTLRGETTVAVHHVTGR